MEAPTKPALLPVLAQHSKRLMEALRDMGLRSDDLQIRKKLLRQGLQMLGLQVCLCVAPLCCSQCWTTLGRCHFSR